MPDTFDPLWDSVKFLLNSGLQDEAPVPVGQTITNSGVTVDNVNLIDGQPTLNFDSGDYLTLNNEGGNLDVEGQFFSIEFKVVFDSLIDSNPIVFGERAGVWAGLRIIVAADGSVNVLADLNGANSWDLNMLAPAGTVVVGTEYWMVVQRGVGDVWEVAVDDMVVATQTVGGNAIAAQSYYTIGSYANGGNYNQGFTDGRLAGVRLTVPPTGARYAFPTGSIPELPWPTTGVEPVEVGGIFSGAQEVTDVKIGSTQVAEVYQGSTKIWPGGPPPSNVPTVVGVVEQPAPYITSNPPYTVDWSSLNQVSGDIVFLMVFQGDSANNTGVGLVDATGWNTIFSGVVAPGTWSCVISLYWGLADTVGTSTVAHTAANQGNPSQWSVTTAAVLRGVDNVTPLDVPFTQGITDTASSLPVVWTPPSITPVTPDCLILGYYTEFRAQLTTEVTVDTNAEVLSDIFYTDWDGSANTGGRTCGLLNINNTGGTVIPPPLSRVLRVNLEPYGTSYQTLAFKPA